MEHGNQVTRQMTRQEMQLVNKAKSNPTPKKRLYIKNSVLCIQSPNGTKTYPLQRVNEKEIINLRKADAHFCLVKVNGKYAVASVPKWFSLNNVAIGHLCGNCSRCYARHECDGGCSKVADLYYEDLQYAYTPDEALELSTRAEKYPFLNRTIEVVHGKDVMIYVLGCDNFKHDQTTPRKETHISVEALHELYQHVRENSTIGEMFTRFANQGFLPYGRK